MGNKYLKTYAPACLIRMLPKVGSRGRGGEGRENRNRGGTVGGGCVYEYTSVVEGGVLRQTDARNQPNRKSGLIEISNFTECEEPWTTEVGDLAYHEGFVL